MPFIVLADVGTKYGRVVAQIKHFALRGGVCARRCLATVTPISPSPFHPRPQPLHGGEAGEADHGPPGIADQPAQKEDFPVTAGHAAEAAA